MMLYVKIAGFDDLFAPVRFLDITPGQMIAHYVEDHNGKDMLWIGLVDEIGTNGNEAYGEDRRYYERYTARDETPTGEWSEATHQVGKDLLIAAVWHATEDGHRLYKVN